MQKMRLSNRCATWGRGPEKTNGPFQYANKCMNKLWARETLDHLLIGPLRLNNVTLPLRNITQPFISEDLTSVPQAVQE